MLTHAIRCGAVGAALAVLFGCATKTDVVTRTGPSTPAQSSALVIVPVQVAIPPTPQGVFDISKVDVQPLRIFQSRPQYPFELKKGGVGGEAMVLLIVRRDGSISDAMVVKATDIRFGESALAAILKWRFRPALVSGQAVDCRLMIPITYSPSPS
jgi:TonB family protein